MDILETDSLYNVLSITVFKIWQEMYMYTYSANVFTFWAGDDWEILL